MFAAQTQEGVRSQSPLCAGEETKNQMNWRNKPDLLLSSWSVGHDMDTNLPQVPVGMDAHSSHGNRLFQFHRGNLRIETRLPPSLPCRPDCSLPSNSPRATGTSGVWQRLKRTPFPPLHCLSSAPFSQVYSYCVGLTRSTARHGWAREAPSPGQPSRDHTNRKCGRSPAPEP